MQRKQKTVAADKISRHFPALFVVSIQFKCGNISLYGAASEQDVVLYENDQQDATV